MLNQFVIVGKLKKFGHVKEEKGRKTMALEIQVDDKRILSCIAVNGMIENILPSCSLDIVIACKGFISMNNENVMELILEKLSVLTKTK